MVWSSSSDKGHNASQSNEGDKPTFLSEIGGGNIFPTLFYFVLLSLSWKLSYL